ncbi:MAG: TonB-dependent receptor [Bacteroidales bacterium]|nr:TonB-dependent receptor [Bacteroidales bacterium]
MSLPDIGTLLRNVAGVNGIRKGGASIDPVIRGYRFSQINVMADDGMKVEGGCPNRMDPVTSHLEPDDVESIEIIKGPYSLRYGPSFGGIIQLNTFKPKPSDNFEIHLKSHTSLSSNPAGLGQYLLFFGGGKKFYFGVSGSYKNYHDYKTGDGNKVSSSFRKYNYSADLGYTPAKNHELLLSLHSNYGRDLMFPSLPMDERKDNTTLISADYHIKNLTSLIRKLDIKVYGSDVYHEMDNSQRAAYSSVVPPYTGLMQAVSKVDASNSGGRIELNLIKGKHELLAGADLEIARKDGGRLTRMIMVMNGVETISTKNTNLWKDSQMINSGVFGTYIYDNQKFKINVSARFDLNQATSTDTLKLIKEGVNYFNQLSSNYTNLSANAGITFPIKGGHSIGFYAGRGMRSPDLTERYIKFLTVGYDSYDYLGNPQLKPEINYQSDLIIDVNLNKAGKLKVDAYASIIDSYISAVPLPASVATPKSMGALGVKQYKNVGQAWFYGFEATYNSPVIKGIGVVLTASYTYGIQERAIKNILENNQVIDQVELKNDAVQEIPPMETRIDLNYRFYNQKMLFTLGSRIVAVQNHVSESYYENAIFGTVLMNMAYEFQVNKLIKLASGIQNLFDKAYYDHLNRRIVGSTSRLYEPGRNYYMNLIINI